MWDVFARANARDGKQAIIFAEEAVVCVMIKTEIIDKKVHVHTAIQQPHLLLYELSDEHNKVVIGEEVFKIREEVELEEVDSRKRTHQEDSPRGPPRGLTKRTHQEDQDPIKTQ